ncbi:unnamed protein product [Symbiodinium microadriaticum]|nr:unnamed protein product [Symbiodinium sp. KB8]CAE7881070.1 unnamed protein product [Symbiodinium microadriaticum]
MVFSCPLPTDAWGSDLINYASCIKRRCEEMHSDVMHNATAGRITNCFLLLEAAGGCQSDATAEVAELSQAHERFEVGDLCGPFCPTSHCERSTSSPSRVSNSRPVVPMPTTTTGDTGIIQEPVGVGGQTTTEPPLSTASATTSLDLLGSASRLRVLISCLTFRISAPKTFGAQTGILKALRDGIAASLAVSPAQVPNGTGVQAMVAPGSAGTEAGVQSTSVPEMDSRQQQTRDVRPGEGTCSGLQAMARDNPSQLPETIAKSVQAKPKGAAMTLDLGGRSEVEPQGSDERPVATQSGYLTPRARPLEAVQPSWMTSMEVPRWMVKLGSLLNGGPSHSPAELAPSPLPAASPLYSTPPGGPAFRLRSPMRARPIPATPTPPSSSSLPAEAIQAEVQRQLQGVMTQLRQYGERNEMLQSELEDARRQLREMRGVEHSRDGEATVQRGLLGDLASAPLDPGLLPGYPVPQREENPKYDLAVQVIKEHQAMQQLQELQVQALSKGSTSVASAEMVKPGSTSLTMLPSLSGGCEAALAFQDWMEVSSSTLADVSEQSGIWWSAVVGAVTNTYERWLQATPLERLNISPEGHDALVTGRWARLNARVASMLLSAMSSELRAEMVAQRLSQNSVRMVYRLHTLYQPGGSAERSDVLRRLQSPKENLSNDSLEEVLKTVPAWPRWLARCQAVSMSPPDASVLARGLMTLTDAHINRSPDAAFRTSMVRTSLRLDGQPSLENVNSYQRHLQAELETLLSSTMTSSTTMTPKIKAVDGGLQPKARDAGRPSGELCKYFAKASGCKRGEKCNYSHSMSGMEKELRAKKCLRCGAESHRQKDCTVGKFQPKGGVREQAGSKASSPGGATMAQSTVATAGTTTTASSDPVQGTPWTIESLIQAAQQVVQGQTSEESREESPEKTKVGMRVLKLRDIRVCAQREVTTALLDSGATHSLRAASNPDEWQMAEEVAVQLAGNHQLCMRITASGTLLMPYKDPEKASLGSATKAQTIVPMGQLIETLGYTMVWGPNECFLASQDGQRLPLQVHGGCPQMQEIEALALIARLEDRKLEQLRNETLTTRDKVRLSVVAMEKHWNHYLYDYVVRGNDDDGWRAVRDAPFLEDLPGECLAGMIPSGSLDNGWDIMKRNGFLTRAQRRKLLNSKRWIVHLFAGDTGHWEIMRLDQGDTSVLELDVARCAGHSLCREETWSMVLWAAKHGKVDVVMGGPPGRTQQLCKGEDRDPKSLKLVARMLWLFAVAQVGREVHGTGSNRDRDVGFMLEYPEGLPTEERLAREREVLEAEERSRLPHARPVVAGWDTARRHWEEVQRPRWAARVGLSTTNGRVCFWDTRMWKLFQREMQMRTVSFDQRAMGGTTKNSTTLGTNINAFMSLDGVRVDEGDALPERGDSDYVWAPGLVRAITVALNFWDREAKCPPRLFAMSPTQWRAHVNGNHAEYRKDCATCVMSRGVGRQHRRVHHPEAYVLTSDVAGPLSPGLDATSKGTMGKNLKYLLVAKYMVPKEFVTDYSGAPPPENDGVVPSAKDDVEPNGCVDELDELLNLEQEEGDAPKELQVPVEIEAVPEGVITSDHLDEDLQEYYPSEEEREEGAQAQEEDEGDYKPDPVMLHGDCASPPMTYLTFAVALPNNQSGTVRRALQDILLYLQHHGLPVYRFHADKGEFYNHMLRNWLRDQGVLATWSEPGIPQSNGHAESTVRWVKDRTRTLLGSASLPLRLWPVAAAMAAAEQRAKVLRWKSSLAAPFGSPVYLKKKAFDKYGPLRREMGLESKWLKGVYVGLSTIVHHGHLVYVPESGDERERFMHTLYVRANLVEPGNPDVEVIVDQVPKPRRKLTSKTPLEEIELRAMKRVPVDVQELATTAVQDVLDDWDGRRAAQIVNGLATAGFFEDRKFGVYRHGGTVGWLCGIMEYPAIAQLLVQLVLESAPEAVFTSIYVSHNAARSMHKDNNNDPHTLNYVLPVRCPEQGGELWVELQPGDVLHGQIERRDTSKGTMYGQMYPLSEGESFSFGPRRFHEVAEWKGDRTVVIAYTPDCLGKLNQQDLEGLHSHGFPIPLSQLPEFHGGSPLKEETPHIQALDQRTSVEEESDAPQWEMYLDLEPGVVKVADAHQGEVQEPMVSKAEVSFTRGIEEILSNLTGPLDVTYNVSPDEVMRDLEKWRPAILKEVKGIEEAITKLHQGSELPQQWVTTPGVQRLPTKFVFTVKPNDKADLSDASTWYKRKARLVICGNMATNDGSQVYTETAPAEAVRMALTLSSRNSWCIAILDVVAAFLRTPLGRSPRDPIVIAQPPRLLEVLGLTQKLELWGLIRALYGLREAPMLWGKFRDDMLRELQLPGSLQWKQGVTITSWWTIRDEQGAVQAIVVVYVDDFMLCGPKEVVQRLGGLIQQMWDTSELTFLGPENSIRFLGMELQRATETAKEIHVYQQGYITELLRAHNVSPNKLDKIPITKDLAAIPDENAPAEAHVIRCAQQVTGEVLWVAQRTRPDLSFTTSVMAALCTRNPEQVLEIGAKVLGYLQRTIDYGLVVAWEDKDLVMFCDAAYAPQGARSHSGWLVTFGGVPISWRSSRQSMITLSTAEAELLAMLDGAVATKGIEAILADVGVYVQSRTIASDSMAALSITSGFAKVVGYWKAKDNDFNYNISGSEGVSQAADQEDRSVPMGRAIPLDYDMAGMCMILLMVLGAMMIWEGLRWLLIEAVTEWTPGSQKRKLRRLRRLQQATTEAIEKELERLQQAGGHGDRGSSSSTTTSTPPVEVGDAQPGMIPPEKFSEWHRSIFVKRPEEECSKEDVAVEWSKIMGETDVLMASEEANEPEEDTQAARDIMEMVCPDRGEEARSIPVVWDVD